RVTRPYIGGLCLSPTGDGLKAVFRVPADSAKHQGSFRAVERHVIELTGCQVDRSRKDLSGMCFVSYDAKTYYSPEAREIAPLAEPEKPARSFSPADGLVDPSERKHTATELLCRHPWGSAAHRLW